MARVTSVAVQDLPETARRLLWTIPEWYSGTEIDDRHIATHRPPTFTPEYQLAVDALQEQGLIQPERVLGKRIAWALTPRGRQVVDGTQGVEMVGDYSESLRHRTGVAIVAHWLRHHREDVRTDRVVEYPGEPGDERVDLLAYSNQDNCSLGFEALTDHNDIELYSRKLDYVRSGDAPRRVAFVFPSRRVATTVLNRLHRSAQTHLDIPNFPVDAPSQWPLDTISRYVAQGKGRYGDHDTTGLPTRLYSYYSLFRQHTAR